MLASISGGTDICSCFALGNPTLPVRQGELQAFGLGLDACALDRESGASIEGAKAELVDKQNCTSLMLAIANGHWETAKALVAPTAAASALDVCDKHGQTCLIAALMKASSIDPRGRRIAVGDRVRHTRDPAKTGTVEEDDFSSNPYKVR